MDNLLVVIPAIKKSAVIPDQLVKKLNSITLIQRAINTAKELTNNILVVTDSEEISLICERNNVKFYKDSKLKIDSNNIFSIINKIIDKREEEHFFIYRANTPLVNSDILKEAYKEFLKNENIILTSVKKLDKDLFEYKDNNLIKIEHNYFKELKSFYIYKKNNKILKPFIIDYEYSIEIESYQDWWICEKILQRKRIIFNVIGSVEIGMGHIYHSLALAHEITDHEIIFVCDEKYKIVVDKIASKDYKVISTKNILKTILELKPDMVINDILNTQKELISILKQNDIKVVNFEDLGDGSKKADLVINELYEEPLLKGEQYKWGHKYIILRDEFNNAKRHKFENVSAVLIAFGGTDQNNLTLLTLESIIDIIKQYNLELHIVCGNGYVFKDDLVNYINNINYDKINLYFGVETVSNIMEKTQIAISSNGRTVYELADMNIVSIIISHHKRESTHSFASLERGFINLGVFDKQNTLVLIKENFQKIVTDDNYRKLLFLNIQKYSFRENKQKIVKQILELL